MGSGQAISFGIMIIAILILSSLIYTSQFYSNEIIMEAKEEDYKRIEKKMKTKIDVINYSLSSNYQSCSILILNNGTTIWQNPDKFDVLCNITYLNNSWNYTFDAWIPYKNLNENISTENIYWDYDILEQNTINPNHIDPGEIINITIYTDINLNSIAFWIKIIIDIGLFDSIEVTVASVIIVYEQNFNSETPGDNPAGWINIEEQFQNNISFRVSNPMEQMTTNSLRIIDEKTNKFVVGQYILNDNVIEGNFEFDISHTWSSGSTTDLYIILEDYIGTDLITYRVFRNAGVNWGFSIQGNGSTYTNTSYTVSDLLNIDITFNGTAFDISVDDIVLSSSLSYTSNSISQINIYSTDLSSGFSIYLDNLQLLKYP